MKKLKLQLSGVKEMLTRDEMKKVIGGGYGYFVTCTYVFESGDGCPGGFQDNPCYGDVSSCQSFYDGICGPDDCCHTVTCDVEGA